MLRSQATPMWVVVVVVFGPVVVCQTVDTFGSLPLKGFAAAWLMAPDIWPLVVKTVDNSSQAKNGAIAGERSTSDTTTPALGGPSFRDRVQLKKKTPQTIVLRSVLNLELRAVKRWPRSCKHPCAHGVGNGPNGSQLLCIHTVRPVWSVCKGDARVDCSSDARIYWYIEGSVDLLTD